MILIQTIRTYLTPARAVVSSSCRTILSTPLVAVLLALPLVLAACGQQGSTTNYYGNQNGGNSTLNNPLANNPGNGGGSTGDGGGGQGVMCGDKLYVRDIYEAVVNKERSMKSVPGANLPETISPAAAKILTDSLKNYFGPSSRLLTFTKDTFWFDFIQHISFLDDQELFPSQDANSPIKLKSGCQLVQIAYWDESTGNSKEDRLYVNHSLWKKLDQLNKLALVAHEYFFAQARKAGSKNSDAVRNQVGLLLSTDGLKPLFQNWQPSSESEVQNVLPSSMSGFKFCEGTTFEDSSARIQLYQYEGSDKKQHLVIPALLSNTINSNYLQGAHFSFDPESNEPLAMATDLFQLQSDFNGSGITVPGLNIRDVTIQAWYKDSGLLTGAPRSVENPFWLLKVKVGNAPTIWTDRFVSGSSPIVLTIPNPLTADDFSEREVLSRKERVAATLQKIKNGLLRCTLPALQADASLGVLQKEITTAIQKGLSPAGFPLWNNEITRLNAQRYRSDVDENQVCELRDENIVTALPAYLYKLNLKSDSLEEGREALGDELYKTTHGHDIALSQIKLKQDGSEVTFNLRCDDYKFLYSRLRHHNKEANELPEPELVYNKNIISHRNLNFSTQDSETSRFLEFIRMANGTNGVDSLTQMFADSALGSLSYDLPDRRFFLHELMTAKNIFAQSCVLKPPSILEKHLNPSSKETPCVILSFKESQLSYMVYFNFDKDGALLQLIRILPNSFLPQKPVW